MGHRYLNVNCNAANMTTNRPHPDPRSGLMESHMFPLIYTGHHFEDLKFGYLQYTKEMVDKHAILGTVLDREDVALY